VREYGKLLADVRDLGNADHEAAACVMSLFEVCRCVAHLGDSPGVGNALADSSGIESCRRAAGRARRSKPKTNDWRL